MELTPYVEQLRRELAVAAEAGGEEARNLAERLTAPLESAVRLALLDALSAASEEITRDLAPGSVDVRIRGRDATFVVTPPPASSEADADTEWSRTIRGAISSWLQPPTPPAPPAAPTPPTPGATEPEESGTSRVTLRLPDHLKARAEEAASQEGLSVNAWLVRAVAAAVEPAERGRRREPRGRREGQHYTGWVR